MRRFALICLVLLLAFTFNATLNTPAHARKYRTIEAGLKHETPLWWQTKKKSGHPVGCGATAWAIVFGYWKQYKGKENLLEGVSMPHNQTNPDEALHKHMLEIAKAMNSTYGEYKGKKWGRSTPKKMSRAKKYATRRGYKCTVQRIRGTEFEKFRQVKKWLDRDRPVVILINNPKKAFSSLHYPVIEKAELKQKRVAGKWRDRDVRYYVNMGHGDRKWIWVREVGKNHHKHTGSFSMFFMDIK